MRKRAERRLERGYVGNIISGKPTDPKLRVQIIMINKGMKTGHFTLG